MSVKRLLSAQSNARSELRAELTENNRLPNLNIQRRHKIRKYNLPENWHVEFKNKCFYCDQHVNGIDGMKGHIRSCKAKLVLEAQEEGDLLYDNIYQVEGFDTEVHENGTFGPTNYGVTTYLLMQQILLIKDTRIKTGNCAFLNQLI